MSESLRTISPVDGSVYVERPLAGAAEINKALDVARAAPLDVVRAPRPPVAVRGEKIEKRQPEQPLERQSRWLGKDEYRARYRPALP